MEDGRLAGDIGFDAITEVAFFLATHENSSEFPCHFSPSSFLPFCVSTVTTYNMTQLYASGIEGHLDLCLGQPKKHSSYFSLLIELM